MARLAEEDRLKQRKIGERIAEAREARRLTQPVVAERVGVSLRAYQNWESGGTRIAWANLERLAKILEVAEDYILSGAGEPAVPVPIDTDQQFVEIDARLANIEQMLTQLLERQPEEAALAAAVAKLAGLPAAANAAPGTPRAPKRRAS